MPPKSTAEATASEASAGIPQLPWSSIPKFTPGVTNVQEYTQKLKFLAAMWPADFLDQLAPRAALLVEGTAFRKVARLDAAKLKVKNSSGVAALVEAIGGSWGATDLEERYEYFEKALYGTVQRHDESHDSFLARMESNFIELLSRNTKLEEVQAYVLLRQSTLPADDKKRILLEHSGELKYDPVVKSFRLLGSKFFNEFQTGKTQTKNRVYDVNFTDYTDGDSGTSQFHDASSSTDRAYQASVDDPADFELDNEYLDALISQEDPDALAVANFEQEFEDFLQDIPEMHEAMVTYMEARSKLLEKRKGRGFWPVKGKGGFKKGRGKGGKSKKDRDQLLARIARSKCRRCGQVGHWKAECPNPPDPSAASANVAEVYGVTVPDEISDHEDEVYSESELDHSVSRCHLDKALGIPQVSDNLSRFSPCDFAEAFVVQPFHHPHIKQDLRNRLQRLKMHSLIQKQVPPSAISKPRYEKCPDASSQMPTASVCFEKVPHVEAFHVSALERPSHAILDTGASRCIIGENVWKRLVSHLSQNVQDQIKTKPSSVKFRFGNNQFLTSHFRVQIPLKCHFQEPKRLWLSLEVVPGSTPFLLSKRAFKQLGGVLDTVNDTCFLQRLNRYVDLAVSKTDLYLIDLTHLCEDPSNHPTVFDNATVHDGLFTESGGNDSSKGKHEHIPECFAKGSKDSLYHQCAPRSNCDSKPSIDRDPNCVASLTHSNHAKSDDGDSQGRGRIHGGVDDHVTANFDIPTGSVQQCRDVRRIQREQSRDASNPGKHGSRTAESSKHPARNHGQPTGHPESSIPANYWTAKWKQSGNCAWRNKHPSWTSHPTSSCTPQRESSGFESSATGPPLSPPGTTATSTWVLADEFLLDTCDERPNVDHCDARDSGSNQASFHHRVGTTSDLVGKEAQRENLVGDVSNRSRILPLVASSLFEPATKPAGVCSFLPDAARSRGQSKWPIKKSCSTDAIQSKDVQFHQEVNQVRDFLCQTSESEKNKSPIDVSFQEAESIVEEVYSSAKSPKLRSSVFLLEVYAGKNSPLTDIAHSMGLKVIRFTREDGNLALPWGRKKLWEWIDKFQPEHIWVAPECGAWEVGLG